MAQFRHNRLKAVWGPDRAASRTCCEHPALRTLRGPAGDIQSFPITSCFPVVCGIHCMACFMTDSCFHSLTLKPSQPEPTSTRTHFFVVFFLSGVLFLLSSFHIREFSNGASAPFEDGDSLAAQLYHLVDENLPALAFTWK